MNVSDIIILIPAFKPNDKLLHLISGLQDKEFTKIIVVDDGSGLEYKEIFNQAQALGCIVKRNEQNMGKGMSLKTAFNTAIMEYDNYSGFITADADGQHLPEDICRVANVMKIKRETLVLGVRNFEGGGDTNTQSVRK